MSSPMTTPPGDKPPTDPDELRADIERTRGELADTVDALVAKTQVRRRVGEKAEEVAEEVKGRVGELTHQAAVRTHQAADQVRRRPAVPAGVLAAVLAALIALLVRRRGR